MRSPFCGSSNFFPLSFFPHTPFLHLSPFYNRLTLARLRFSQVSLILMGEKLGEGGKVRGNGINEPQIARTRALAFLFSVAVWLVMLARSRASARFAALSTLLALVAVVCEGKKR